MINGGRTFTFGELAEEAADRSPPSNPPLRTAAKGAADRPAAAAARRTGQGRRKLALRRRRPIARHAVRIGTNGAAGRAAARLFARRDREAAGRPARRRARRMGRGRRRHLVGGRARAEGSRPGFFAASERRPTCGRLFENALAQGDAQNWFSRGDYDGADTRIAAACRDLLCGAVAASRARAAERDRARRREVELWAATQAPGSAARRVTLYPMPPGEPAGRAMEADAVPIAIELARAVGRPVQVVLSQSASQNHDRVAPGALARMTALPGQAGSPPPGRCASQPRTASARRWRG